MKLKLILKEEAKLEIIDAYQYYESAKLGLGEIFLTIWTSVLIAYWYNHNNFR